MEARVSLKGLVKNLNQGRLSPCRSPEPVLVPMLRSPKVREVWGCITLLSTYYAPGTVLTREIRIARFLLSWNLPPVKRHYR